MVSSLTGGELDRLAAEIDIQVPKIGWNEDTNSFETGTRQVQGHEYAVLAMTVLFVAYGMAGGLGAAIITDFVQGILTIAFSFLLLPFVFYMIGGFGSLHEQAVIKPGMLNIVADAEAAASMGKEQLTVFYVFMVSLMALTGIVVQPHIMGVCGAGKTEFEGRFGFTVGNFLKRFCTMAWTFTGLACIVWYLGTSSPLKDSDDPADRQLYQSLQQRLNFDEYKTTLLAGQLSDEEADRIEQLKSDWAELPSNERMSNFKRELAALEGKRDDLPEADVARINSYMDEETAKLDGVDKKFADGLFGRAAYDILPRIMPGLVGLLLASLLAAMMSSGDAQMVVSSGLFTDNIYRRFLVKEASQRHYLWTGRIAGLIIVAISLIVQSTFGDVIDAIKVVFKTPAAIGISLWFGLIWRGWTPKAVWVSTIVAVSTWWFVGHRADLLVEICPESWFNAKGKLLDPWVNVAYLGSGIISGLVVSFLTKRTDAEKLDHFYTLIHTPVKPDEEVAAPCTLPEDPAPKGEKLIPGMADIEIPRPSMLGIGGFVGAWILVYLIIEATKFFARTS